MIKSETIEINGVEFIKTYSTCGVYLERDGYTYSEAIDPVGITREYTETNEKIIEREEE